MSDRKQFLVGILIGRVTAPIILSADMAVSIFLEQFMVTAGVLAGASLILSIVRWSNQRDEPLTEIVEIVFRNEAQDSAWMEELRQKHRDSNETTIRIWRQYASAVWILLAALRCVSFAPNCVRHIIL